MDLYSIREGAIFTKNVERNIQLAFFEQLINFKIMFLGALTVNLINS